MFRGTPLWMGVISGGISQVEDTRALAANQISARQYAANTTRNVTGAVGLMAGVEYGAVLGTSLLPGLGTVAGAMIGAVVGDRLGRYAGTQAGQLLFANRMREGRQDGQQTQRAGEL
jgi:outer membrane lipoprotein SlyB